jgi:hypothetical protein
MPDGASGGASTRARERPGSDASCTSVRAFSAAETFGETGVQQFKVGRDIYGMLRPDKLVAYFATQQQLCETSERLYARVGGMAAHGVPFTCELHGDGLLSWGMDPPKRAQVLAWQERQSWRFWVVNTAIV